VFLVTLYILSRHVRFAAAIVAVVSCGGGTTSSGAAAPSAAATAPSPTGDASGIATCSSKGLTFVQAMVKNAVVAAGYSSTAAAVAQWQEKGRFESSGHASTSSFRDYPPSEPVAVCFLHGDFAMFGKYPPPPPTGTPFPSSPYDRIVLFVPQNHAPTVDVAGHPSNLPVTDHP
jgi:CubicO group peptidase (beta-lactamase class C family)